LLQLGSHGTTPFILVVSNKSIVTCLGSQLLEMKFTTTMKTSCAPFDIQRSKVHMVETHPPTASCKCFVKVSYTNVSKTFLARKFQDGKTTLKHNMYAMWCTQFYFKIIRGKNPLITNNMTYSNNKKIMCFIVFVKRINSKEKSKEGI
jgi:hypothetical protein